MIYKPTDLSPSAQSFDCQKPPIYLECKLDTSNVIARGFTVKVYNSDNDLVFSSIPEGEPLDIKYISLISDLDQGPNLLNSGYNGSYLKIPFIINFDDRNTENTLEINQIFYISEEEAQTKEWVFLSNSNLYQAVKQTSSTQAFTMGGHYKRGSTVLSNNIVYYCTGAVFNIAPPISASDTDHWKYVSDETSGIPSYDSGVLYYAGDIVLYEGHVFKCTGLVIGTGQVSSAISSNCWKKYIPVDIYNGQSYKWAITIYQLEKQGNNWILPNNPLYYDMPLTTGTILGSNDIRIQGVRSDEIYSDYFVQPVYISGLKYDPDYPDAWTCDSSDELILQGARALVKSYDSVYGYIYPVIGEDGLTTDVVSPTTSNAFQIYKQSNNTDDLSVTQQVNYVCDSSISEVTGIVTGADKHPGGGWNGSIGAYNWEDNSYWKTVHTWRDSSVGDLKSRATGMGYSEWDSSAEYSIFDKVFTIHTEDGGTSYWVRLYTCAAPYMKWQNNPSTPGNSTWEQSYFSLVNPEGVYNVYFSNIYNFNTQTTPNIKIPLQGGERIVFNHVLKGQNVRDGIYIGSPYNGIFYPQITTTSFVPENKVLDYSSETTYSIGQYVSVGGKYYQCDKSNLKGVMPPAAGWSPIPQYYQVEIKWIRTPDANSWASLMNKIVMVTSPYSDAYYQRNIQIQGVNEDSMAYGTINETPFLFIPEKPIEIYKNHYSQYKAGLNCNVGDVVTYMAQGTYTLYNNSSDYIAGSLVYDSNLNPKYYVCIKNAQGKELSDTEYWSRYTKQSCYKCKQIVAQEDDIPPINPDGTLQSDYWIYTPYLSNTGVIFYNNPLGTVDPISDSSSDEGRLYIRPFAGLERGMVLFKNTNNNEKNYIHIKDYNSDYNFVTYDKLYTYDSYLPYDSSTNPTYTSSSDITWTPADSQGNGTKYQIKTFFRESDETAFNFYSDGSIENLSVVQDGMGNVTVSAEYSQIQYIQWKSAQWFLYNINNALIAASDIIYDKELKWTFYGLDNGNYTVKLVIENYVGATQENSSSFDISSGYEQASGDLAVSFNCESMTIDTSVITDVVDLSIYKREVWYTFTGQFEDSSVWGKKIPVVEGHAEDIWHLVHQGDGIALGPNSIINDFNIANSRYYEYKYLYKKRNTNTVYTSTLALKTKWDGWTLTELHPVDGEGKQYTASLSDVWKFKYNISPGDTTQNFSKNAQDTLASFPKFVQGPKNNLTGSVTCLLGRDVKPFDWIDIDYSYSNGAWTPGFASRGYNAGGYQEQLWPEVSYDDLTSNRSVDMLNRFRDFCFSGNPKLLKDNKGRSFIVEVHDTTYHIEETWNGRPVTISLNWTEIENADDIEIVGQSAYYTSGMSYSLYNSGKSYALTGRGESEDVNIFIPNTINNKPVTKIDFGAFEYDDDLEFVVTPDNMQIISSKAFSQCTSLRGVNFTNKGKNISYIGEGAFSGCTSLSSISIPTGVTIINTKVFENCTALEEVKLNNVESIGTSAFAGCSSLSSIKLPDSLTILKTKAFERCSDLRRVEYGNSPSLYRIEEGVFSRCNNLSSIYIPSSVSIMSSKVFSHCKSLESITFGDDISLNKISNGVFNYCEKLSSIIIPDTVTEIGGNAFRHCDKLVSITIPSNVSSIGSYAFGFCSKLQMSSLPNNITSISEGLFYDCGGISSFTIGADVNMIQPYAFAGCNNLTAVTFENTNGWFITSDPSATTGTSIAVTNTETNADNLVTTYNEYYWKRSI